MPYHVDETDAKTFKDNTDKMHNTPLGSPIIDERNDVYHIRAILTSLSSTDSNIEQQTISAKINKERYTIYRYIY